MPLSAEISENEVTIAPGDTTKVTLRVQNVGDEPETVALITAGLCSGWTNLEPPSISLFPDEVREVEVHVRPPRSPAVPAGANALTIRVVPHGAPDDAISVDGVIHVLAFSERRVTVLQPVLRGRRRAEFDVVVENLGNTSASCRLALGDPARRLSGRFQPPSVGVEPGRNAASTARVRSRRRRWRGGTGSYPFEVTAIQEGHPAAAGSATFLQSTIVPSGSWRWVLATLALAGALAGFWWGLALPAIDRAADDAVRDLAPTMTAPPVTVTITAPGVTAPTTITTPTIAPPVNTTPGGELFAFRLPVQASVGGTSVADFDTPAGNRIEVTDIVLQNPNGDLGQARLLRNSDVLLTWRLDNIIGDDVKQYVSPYELRTGDRLSLEVSCTGAGDPTVGTCTTSVSITGRMYPT